MISMVKKLAFTLTIVCLLFAIRCDKLDTENDPPIWPAHFSMSITQKVMPNSSSFEYNTGKIWVDYDKNNLRMQKNDSRYDSYCNAVLPNWSVPCTQIINKGIKYVVFPNNNLCCECCNIADPNCPFWRRDWLINSTYAGTRVINWNVYDQWLQTMGNTTYVYL